MTDPSGFRGKYIEDIASVTDESGHTLTVALYEFDDGVRKPYVTVAEQHEGAERLETSPFPLADMVHFILNVGPLEVWKIIGRDGPSDEVVPW